MGSRWKRCTTDLGHPQPSFWQGCDVMWANITWGICSDVSQKKKFNRHSATKGSKTTLLQFSRLSFFIIILSTRFYQLTVRCAGLFDIFPSPSVIFFVSSRIWEWPAWADHGISCTWGVREKFAVLLCGFPQLFVFSVFEHCPAIEAMRTREMLDQHCCLIGLSLLCIWTETVWHWLPKWASLAVLECVPSYAARDGRCQAFISKNANATCHFALTGNPRGCSLLQLHTGQACCEAEHFFLRACAWFYSHFCAA